MKKLLLSLMLTVFSVISGWASVQITNVALQTSPAYSCSTNVIVVSAQLGGANYTFVANNVSVFGNTININVEYSVGGIVLPAITFVTQNVTLPTLSSGNYTVNVTGYLNSTAGNTMTMPLNVLSCCGAEADFTVLDGNVCVGDFTGVNNTSSGTTDQDWYVNGNYLNSSLIWQTDTLSPGTYIVKLVVNNGTCSDSMQGYITVYDNPSITSLTPVSSQVCENGLVEISAVTQATLNYSWTVDGTPISTFQQLSVGANAGVGPHTYELTASNPGCPPATDSEVITIIQGADAGQVTPFDTTICLGESLDFTNATSANFDAQEWFIDGSSAATTGTYTHTFNASGTYSISYEANNNNGCSDSTGTTVTVMDGPTATTLPDTNACNGPIVLDAGAGYTTYAWSDGSTTQTITVSTEGTYECTVTNANGCSAIISVTVNGCLGLDDETMNLGVEIYPNPASDIVYISSDLTDLSYEVYTLEGQLLSSGTTNQINLSEFSKGIYLVKVRSEHLNATRTLKLVKN